MKLSLRPYIMGLFAVIIAFPVHSLQANEAKGFYSPEIAAKFAAQLFNSAKTPRELIDSMGLGLKDEEVEGVKAIFAKTKCLDDILPSVAVQGSSLIFSNGEIAAKFQDDGTVLIDGKVLRKSSEPIDKIMRSLFNDSSRSRFSMLDLLIDQAWAEDFLVPNVTPKKAMAYAVLGSLLRPWAVGIVFVDYFYMEVKAADLNHKVSCSADGGYLIKAISHNDELAQATTVDVPFVDVKTEAKQENVDPKIVAQMFNEADKANCTPKNAAALEEALRNARNVRVAMARMHRFPPPTSTTPAAAQATAAK